jgi:hypothetical protein
VNVGLLKQFATNSFSGAAFKEDVVGERQSRRDRAASVS